eukprot:GHUV01016620.1.p1 GENE.GHUV01016620.1~~GHUV01016620.1.p1  ORF type:complete len:117 (-),score=5.25 GHUV01016620.1:1655-2005(-)
MLKCSCPMLSTSHCLHVMYQFAIKAGALRGQTSSCLGLAGGNTDRTSITERSQQLSSIWSGRREHIPLKILGKGDSFHHRGGPTNAVRFAVPHYSHRVLVTTFSWTPWRRYDSQFS